jgi:hypothetical protein
MIGVSDKGSDAGLLDFLTRTGKMVYLLPVALNADML